MTQDQFNKIKNLTEKIERYEKILDLAKSDEENGRKGFAYYFPSTFAIDYLRYPIQDEELNSKMIELVKEKLVEMKREFNDITIM